MLYNYVSTLQIIYIYALRKHFLKIRFHHSCILELKMQIGSYFISTGHLAQECWSDRRDTWMEVISDETDMWMLPRLRRCKASSSKYSLWVPNYPELKKRSRVGDRERFFAER